MRILELGLLQRFNSALSLALDASTPAQKATASTVASELKIDFFEYAEWTAHDPSPAEEELCIRAIQAGGEANAVFSASIERIKGKRVQVPREVHERTTWEHRTDLDMNGRGT